MKYYKLSNLKILLSVVLFFFQIENIVEPHLFGYILDFVYTGEMHFEASTSSNIYFLAKHLGVDKLIELCKVSLC